VDLKHILAATDNSPGGRHAVRTARSLAGALHAALAILTVESVRPQGPLPAGRLVSTLVKDGPPVAELSQLSTWLGSDGTTDGLPEAPELAVGFGIAGIEIGRFATLRSSDLIVVGRRPRAPDHRLILGETADALVRRSGTPILFVPPEVTTLRYVLLALDPTERSARVARVGLDFARTVGATVVEAVTVRRDGTEEASGPSVLPGRRPVRIDQVLHRAAAEMIELGPIPLTIRQGDPIEEVLAEAASSKADVLVIGYRRGGPPKYVSPTEIARNILYAAPCAVLTVPL
jgi:nucleotide-binding universal stress UspA family protein